MEVWKAFEKNIISHSAAHHLMTIYYLLERNGYARVSDVARSLEITRGSASITLKALKEKGLVREDENKFLRLSEEGQRISHAIRSTRVLFKKFLVDILQVDSEQAEIDACKIEHLLSHETGEKLLSFMQFLASEEQPVRDFLDAYRDYESTCCGMPDDCEVCETECLKPLE
ncbi:MAG: metal-dependent transcriptional regulator [bacterium]